jgi:hypothetical protein
VEVPDALLVAPPPPELLDEDEHPANAMRAAAVTNSN